MRTLIAGLCLLPCAAWAQTDPAARAPHQVAFANQGGQGLREIYIAPQGAENWGANRLVSAVPTGFGASIRYTGPCQANLRVVMDGGRSDERHNISVCSQTNFTITGNSVTSVANGMDTPDAGDPVRYSTPVAAPPPRLAPPPAQPALSTSAQPAVSTSAQPVVSTPADPGPWNGHYLTHHYGGL